VDDEGNVTFTPEEGFTGEASIPYTATDRDGNPLEPSEITVQISELVDDEASTAVNTPVTFNIAENDGDIDPESIDLNPDRNGIQKTRRVRGQVTFEVDDEGNVTFTPEDGFTGEASIPYTATDSDGNPLEPADITVTVSPLNPDTAVSQPNEPVTFNIAENDGDIDPASIDLDPDTPGVQKEITVPGQGTFEVDDEGNVTFTPEEGFVGEASIPYTATDNDGNPLPPSEITVSVASTDNPPEAVDDSATTPVNTPVTLDVLSNDSDPDGDTLTVTQVNDDAENGTVTLNDDGTVTYTPNPGFTGEDTFTYEISDGNGGTDTATVTVTIEDDSNPLDDTASTLPNEPIVIDVLNNDSIGNDDRPLRIISFTQPENGTVELDDNGTPDDPTDDRLIYTPNPGFEGIDTFTYTISDGNGGTDTATVTITITGVDDTFWLYLPLVLRE
jgi:CshA-type fibril repeat protein